jgi:hypothetical protein
MSGTEIDTLYSALETIGNQITCARGRNAWTDDLYAELDAIDRQINRLQLKRMKRKTAKT